MYSNKQIHMDVDTIVSLVIQSMLVSEGGRISCCIMLIELRVKYETTEAMQIDQPGWEYLIKLLYVYVNMQVQLKKSVGKVKLFLHSIAWNC